MPSTKQKIPLSSRMVCGFLTNHPPEVDVKNIEHQQLNMDMQKVAAIVQHLEQNRSKIG